MTQVGGRIYVGGSFTQAGPNTGFGVALDPSTGVWAPAFPKINGTVLVAVPDGSGGFYIGGDFTRVGDRSRHNGARVVPGATPGMGRDGLEPRDRQADPGHRPGALGQHRLHRRGLRHGPGNDGLGGDRRRQQVHRQPADPGFDPGTGTATTVGTGAAAVVTVGSVAALAVSPDGTRLFVGGFFTKMAGAPRSGLAALNAATGALDAAFDPAPSAGGVETMALTASGRLLLGGGFTKIGATTRNRLAAVNAATGALDAWAPSADGTVHTLRPTGDGAKVYVGGAFANIGDSARSGLALLSAATGAGALDGTWKPVANADVSALALSADGSRLFAAGAFTKLGGAARNYLGSVFHHRSRCGGQGGPTPPAGPSPWPRAAEDAAQGGVPGVVFGGGTFASVNGTARANLAAFDAATGALVTGFVANTDKAVGDIQPSADGASLYVGGLFKKVNGLSRREPAGQARRRHRQAVDGAWAPKANYAEVKTLAVAAGKVYVGGAFSTINGSSRNRAAAVDGGSGALSSWNPNVSNVVWAIDVSPDAKSVYLAGAFTTVKGSTRKNVAAVSASTASPTTWKPAVTAPGRRLEVTASQVFVTLAGLSNTGGNRLVAIAAGTGAKQWEGTADGDVVALAVDGSTVYAGGHFDLITGSNIAGENRRDNLAAFDGATGSLKAWAPPVSGTHGVWALSASGGSVVAGGDFQVVSGVVAAGLARFPNG